MAPRKAYTPKQMGDAISAVQGGEPVATAAKRYGVPRITLHNKMSGKSPMQCSMGPSTVLTVEEEDLLVKWIIAAAKRRFPVSREQLMDSVMRIVMEQKRSTPFTGNRPGKKWFASFMKRHPIVAQRTAENLTSSRDAVSEEQIDCWFREVKEYLTSMDLTQALKDPSRVFNTDESAFFLSPKPGKVLVKKGEKHVYCASGDDKENLTVLVTANAAGKIAPPMIVYSYERIPANIASSVPEDWAIGKSESGWMCSDTFFEYISTVFNPWLIKENIQKPILFFMDGHKSHLTLHLSHFCSENGIEIIALYPNATHILQPMDIAVFRPLKIYFRKEVVQWRLENMGNKLKKEDFAPVFKKALDQISKECIKNGFRGGGLHPFGSEYIDMSKLRSAKPNKETNEQKELETKLLLRLLDSKITQIFGPDKLEMYNSLYFEGRNVLENMALDEDLNLYIVWAHMKQISATPEINEETADTASTSFTQAQRSTHDAKGTLDTAESANQNAIMTDTNIPATSTALNSVPQNKGLTYNVKDTTVAAGSADEIAIINDTNVPTTSTTSISSVPEQVLIQDADENPTLHATIAAVEKTLSQEQDVMATFEISATNDSETQPNKSGCTPQKNELGNALGVKVPSPFKKCLFWPQNVSTKRTNRKKEKVPSAVTSKAWQEYHEKKEAEKKRLQEEKDLRAKIRLEKKELREKLAKEKKIKMKGKKKKPNESSSEDTDIEINYIESGESELNEDSDSTWYEEAMTTTHQVSIHSGQRKRKIAAVHNSDIKLESSLTEIRSKENTKNDLNMGCFVIIKYEGEYFPGKIENKDKGQYEISTMVLSTGNNFRWPDRPDKIWYKMGDIVEVISPPIKHNNRGFYKVPEMEKFLPDLYMT